MACNRSLSAFEAHVELFMWSFDGSQLNDTTACYVCIRIDRADVSLP